MSKINSIFIATSLDNLITDKDGGLDWLNSFSNPDNDDLGFVEFMNSIDAIVMGRKTFETVIQFDVPWPYNKPVFVLSNSLKEIPNTHKEKAFLVNGSLSEILNEIHQKGHEKLYIDGGSTIRSFLKADLIDEMIITTIPILLGGGAPLFGTLNNKLEFKLTETKMLLNQISQSFYKRRR